MPVPDQSRPGRASDLIKRFQAAVDHNAESPLTVSSSFASPGPRPRVSTGAVAKARDSLGGSSSPTSADDARDHPPAPAPASAPAPAPAAADEHELQRDEGLTAFRSAGLADKPQVPIGEQGRKNAAEAFPDMRPAPEVTLAKDRAQPVEEAQAPTHEHEHERKLETTASDAVETESPAPVVEPAREASPAPGPDGAEAALDSAPNAEPVSSTDNADVDVAPRDEPEAVEAPSSRPPSPSRTPEKAPSRAASPAGTAPAQAAPSPPSSRPVSPPLVPTPSKPAAVAPPPRSSRAAPASPAPSASPSSTSPTLSRTRSRPSRSPTQTRTTPQQQPTVPVALPTTGRGLTTPTASSLAKARPRVPSGSGSTSPNVARARTPGSSPDLPRSARMSPTASREGTGMVRARSGGAGPAAGAGSPRRAPSATAQQQVQSPSPSTTSSPARAPGPSATAAPLRLRGGAAPTTPLKMARRGRIGLAGAGASRPAAAAAPATADRQDEGEGPSGTAAVQDEAGRVQEQQAGAHEQGQAQEQEQGEAAGEPDAKLDDIPVFKGFGAARPHGHIPIPMQQTGADGEPKRAVMADEVEAAGKKAGEEEDSGAPGDEKEELGDEQ